MAPSDGYGAAGRSPWAWMVLVVAATLLFSRALACATPFAGLAALAALTLGRRHGAALVLLAWAANQVVGFGVLHYPMDGPTLAWGGAIGLAALAGWACARACTGFGAMAAVPALVLGFAAYEGVLLAATLVLPSGPGAFAAAVVARLFLVNAAAFALLLLARQVAARLAPSLPTTSGPALRAVP